jgi:hypothetical protein
MSTLPKFKDQTESSEDYGPVVDGKKGMKTSQYGMTAAMRKAFDYPQEAYKEAEEERKEEQAYAKMHPEYVVPIIYVNDDDDDGLAKQLGEFKKERGEYEKKDDKSKEISDDGRTWAEKIEAAEKEEEAKQKQKEEEQKQEEEEKRVRAETLASNKLWSRETTAALKEGRTTAKKLRATEKAKEKANKGIGGKRTRHKRKKSRRTTRKNKRGTHKHKKIHQTTRKHRRGTHRRR